MEGQHDVCGLLAVPASNVFAPTSTGANSGRPWQQPVHGSARIGTELRTLDTVAQQVAVMEALTSVAALISHLVVSGSLRL